MRAAKITSFKSLKIQRKNKGFILLEVIVSLIILSVTIGTIMRSFTLSLKTIRKAEVVNVGSFLAEELLEEYEVYPPKLGKSGESFEQKGAKYVKYHYETELKVEDVDYDGFKLESDNIKNLEQLYRLTIDIIYDDSIYGPTQTAHLETYLLGIERFTAASKKENALF